MTPPGGTPVAPTWEGNAYRDGPGVIAACVGTLILTAIPVASLQVYYRDLHEAVGNLDSANRELQMVQENTVSIEVILLYQDRQKRAQSAYNAAKQALHLASGVTVGAISAAVVVCSPSLLLPTP